MTTYLKIDYPLEEQNKFLEVEVHHCDGGWNGRPRGIKLRVTQVEKKEGSYAFQLFDPRNRSFHVETLKRRTHSVGKTIAAFVKQHQEDIIDAALRQDWDTIAGILSSRRPV